MSEEAMEFLSYDEALKIVAAIQEEEDVDNENRRVLTVYNYDDREICWFDFDEVMAAVGEVPAGERKQSVQDYILKHIPTWALEI
ncbi:hypothetical protein KQH41_02670 [bacterium]|nr:hypothetical protein [bacterium]